MGDRAVFLDYADRDLDSPHKTLDDRWTGVLRRSKARLQLHESVADAVVSQKSHQQRCFIGGCNPQKFTVVTTSEERSAQQLQMRIPAASPSTERQVPMLSLTKHLVQISGNMYGRFPISLHTLFSKRQTHTVM